MGKISKIKTFITRISSGYFRCSWSAQKHFLLPVENLLASPHFASLRRMAYSATKNLAEN